MYVPIILIGSPILISFKKKVGEGAILTQRQGAGGYLIS